MKLLFTVLWLGCLGALAAASLLPNLILTPYGSDKALHITSYCVLMLYPVLFFKRAPSIILLAITIFIFGVFMESMQGVIGGRVTEALDAFANGAGILLGLITGSLIKSGLNAKPTTA